MAITLDRKTPGVFGIFFGAVLSIALGALLAVAHLAAKPVEVVSTAPKEPVEGVRYFIQGAPAGGAGKTWERKKDQLESGAGEVVITEAEMNAWAAETFKPVEVEEKDKQGTVMIIVGTPNFRVAGAELQAGVVNTVNFFGTEAPLVLQARGGFVRAGEKWRFKPSEAYLGGLPLHRVPALMSAVADRFGMGGNKVPADLEKVLARASAITTRDGELVVRMP